MKQIDEEYTAYCVSNVSLLRLVEDVIKGFIFLYTPRPKSDQQQPKRFILQMISFFQPVIYYILTVRSARSDKSLSSPLPDSLNSVIILHCVLLEDSENDNDAQYTNQTLTHLRDVCQGLGSTSPRWIFHLDTYGVHLFITFGKYSNVNCMYSLCLMIFSEMCRSQNESFKREQTKCSILFSTGRSQSI